MPLFDSFQPTISKAGLARFSLSLECALPCKPLSRVVHSYLQINASKPTPYPVMPDGTQSIFISPYGAMLGGAQSQVREIPILEPGKYFGIRFYPGVLRFFFDLDLSEITDQLVDDRFLPCRYFAEIHNEIYRHQHFNERARVCEKWLLKHYTPLTSTPFDQALSLIHQAFGNTTVNHLASRVGLSNRHLNRLFKQHTGLSPKIFSHIIRSQHAYRWLYEKPDESLEIAMALGFFDQSHFYKSMRQSLLSNPRLFFEQFKSDFYNP